MTEQQDQAWTERLRRRLETSAQNLSAADLARLRSARQAALQGAQEPLRPVHSRPRAVWTWPVAGAVAATIAIAVAGFLWFAAPRAPQVPQALDSLEVLALLDQVELYVDFDFYEWLAEQADKG